MIHPDAIAFDIDGVIADTMNLFIHIAKTEFNISNIDYNEITDYDLSKCLDIEFKTIWDIIEIILSGKKDVHLKPIDGAKNFFHKLEAKTKKILLVTARPDDESIKSWIFKNIQIDPSKLKLIATGDFKEKAKILLKHKITHFVEDRLGTCYLLQEQGISPIIFSQPWNNKKHPFTKVNSWDELEKLIDLK